MHPICRALTLLLTTAFCLPAKAGPFPSQLRNGLGFDLPVGTHGNVHLTIHERSNPEKVGLRFQLADRLSEPPAATWSIGPVVKLIRCQRGQRFIRMVPQLRTTLPWQKRKVHAAINYGYWSADGRKTPLAERTIQAQVSLKF